MKSMAELRLRHELGEGASLNLLAQLLELQRPVGVRTMIERWKKPIVLEEPLVTSDGVALGGHHKVTLNRDGHWRYEGHFRATGWPSYVASVAAHITGTDGTTLVFSAHGEVFGTNEPGDREYSWTQQGYNPIIFHQWAGLKRASLTHVLEHDVDLLGTAGDVVAFVAKVSVAAALGGIGGVVVLCAIEAIDMLGLQELALPGTAGLIVAGGIVLICGPGAIIPALVAGIAVGAVVAALVKQRRLSDEEWKHVESVFRGQLPRERIVVTNLLGFGGRPFTTPGPGDAILLHLGDGYDDPLRYDGDGNDSGRLAPGQLLMHELTHAWQIAHSDFIPGLMCRGIVDQLGTLGGDMSVYAYGPPTSGWGDFNLEQQASVIDEWYAGSAMPPPSPSRQRPQRAYPPMVEDDVNPYWRYVRDNLRAGVA